MRTEGQGNNEQGKAEEAAKGGWWNRLMNREVFGVSVKNITIFGAGAATGVAGKTAYDKWQDNRQAKRDQEQNQNQQQAPAENVTPMPEARGGRGRAAA